jgi:hypothetical protein
VGENEGWRGDRGLSRGGAHGFCAVPQLKAKRTMSLSFGVWSKFS